MLRGSVRLLTAVLLTAVLSGCSSMSVTSDYDPGFDFASATTFAFPSTLGQGTAGAGEVSPLVARRVMSAIETELTAKGMSRTDPEQADFIVVPHGGTERRTEVTSSPYAYPYHPWWGDSGVNVYEFTQGTLLIDFVDRRTNEMVWRGTATAVVDDQPSEEKIAEATRRILEKYPPVKTQRGNTHTESGW